MSHPLQLLFSPLSELDLEEIGDYIARDNPQKAVSFIRGIREQCARITANPEAAPLRNELGEGIRMVPYGNYLIFYTAEKFIIVEGLLKILDEPDHELDTLWADEAERRLLAYREGKLRGIPMETIFPSTK